MLEQAKKRDHKVFITDLAISKVGKVLLSDQSEDQAAAMQQCHKELLRLAKEKNGSNEVLLITDLSFKNVIPVFGSEFNVSPGKNPFAVSAMAHSAPGTIAFLHNHPSTSNFSSADIDTFICESAIKTMSVVTNQGEVYVLNKSKKYDFDKTKALLFEIVRDNNISSKRFVSEFLRRCGEGGIEYGKVK